MSGRTVIRVQTVQVFVEYPDYFPWASEQSGESQ